MDNFNNNAKNNNKEIRDNFKDIYRFMDARDYGDHSYDMQVENNKDLRDNFKNIQDFMNAEITSDKTQ